MSCLISCCKCCCAKGVKGDRQPQITVEDTEKRDKSKSPFGFLKKSKKDKDEEEEDEENAAAAAEQQNDAAGAKPPPMMFAATTNEEDAFNEGDTFATDDPDADKALSTKFNPLVHNPLTLLTKDEKEKQKKQRLAEEAAARKRLSATKEMALIKERQKRMRKRPSLTSLDSSTGFATKSSVDVLTGDQVESKVCNEDIRNRVKVLFNMITETYTSNDQYYGDKEAMMSLVYLLGDFCTENAMYEGIGVQAMMGPGHDALTPKITEKDIDVKVKTKMQEFFSDKQSFRLSALTTTTT